MQEPPASPLETAAPTPPDAAASGARLSGSALAGVAGSGGIGRVRLSFYVAFALLALAVLLQGWSVLQRDELRSADSELTERALHLRSSARQIARLAKSLEATPVARVARADALQGMLGEAARDEDALRELLERQRSRGHDAYEQVGAASRGWLAASAELRRRGELLLRSPGIGGVAADGEDDGELAQNVVAVGRAADGAIASAQSLVNALRAASAQGTQDLQRDVRFGIGTVLALLLALALLVVEPTGRAVRRHGQRLRDQATELQRLALVAEHTTAVVLITDEGDRIVWANAAFARVSGWTLADALGKTPQAIVGDDLAYEAARQRARSALAEGHGLRMEWPFRDPGGREVWLDVDLRPLRAPDGSTTGFIRVCTDVTSRVLQQAKLQALWAALPAGVVVQSADGRIVDANRAVERLLGITTAELEDLRKADSRWQAQRADGSRYVHSELAPLHTLRTGEPVRNQTVGLRLQQGRMRWLLVNTEPQLDRQGRVTGVVTCFTDISESRALQERLIDNARTDALTRLPNRAVVMERVQRAIAHARRNPGYGFAVLFMDFDRFKQVNDTLGHGAGDELLRQIAQRLEATLRPGDALARLQADARGGAVARAGQVAARLGGDEFVVVLEGVADAATVAVVAQRLLEEVAEPYTIGSAPVHSSASIGVVLYAGDEAPDDAEEVLRNADTAMYEAKRAGRNRWVLFDDSMQQRVVRALALENDLRRALAEGELFAVYQPVVDLATREMVGVEALVRWNHPVRGLVPPADFIGVAEETGLIDGVGQAVLREACSQFVAWRASMPAAAPQLLAVNLSRAQLERPGLVADVAAAMKSCRMDPTRLVLEVTESLAAQDDHVQQTLRDLKQLGVRLALDDFGTGYSSLACLHQMPVDIVKIDRSFVRHAETVEYHRVLIEATIRVARALGMTTVAEGIETAGQAALMSELECDRGQGYLFSPPLAAAELGEWAQAYAARQRAPAAPQRHVEAEAETDTVQ